MRRRILITGTSGTEKRAIGALLALERGFRHLDAAAPAGISTDGLQPVLRAGQDAPRDVVATWSGPCPDDLADRSQRLDYEWIWLDGDRGAARLPGSSFVDPFAADRSFRPLGAVVPEAPEV